VSAFIETSVAKADAPSRRVRVNGLLQKMSPGYLCSRGSPRWEHLFLMPLKSVHSAHRSRLLWMSTITQPHAYAMIVADVPHFRQPQDSR
jgi:hypothetical protein